MPDSNGAPSTRWSRDRPRTLRSRGLGLALGLAALVALEAPALAIQPRGGSQALPQTSATHVVAPGVDSLRTTRAHQSRTPPPQLAARQALEVELGSDVLLRFDGDTGVTDLVIPSHAQVPGASASAGLAEQFAANFIARHLDALAPGASASDFVLVSDVSSQGLRTLGFVQHSGGLEVLGGQLSFSFRADHLVAVRSQALPHVQLAPLGLGAARVAPSEAEFAARSWISQTFADGDPTRAQLAGSPSATLAILPLVHADGSIEYREVLTTEVRLDRGGLWRVWVDARSGQALARRDLQANAQIEFVTYQRNPYGQRVAFPASNLAVEVGGQTLVTNANGVVAADNASVYFQAAGPYAAMNNDSGALAEVDTLFGPNEQFVWDLGDDPEADAQLSAFIHTNIVKDHVREIDPGFSIVDLETEVTVNISDICNAFAEANTINFFLAGGGCNNTALIADVVYHEYGHVAHILGLQEGVGLFDGGVSEGASDYLSATIVDSPQVGVGFFADSQDPIRDLDPPGSEWSWPDDIGGGVHSDGQVLGGTLWDLRELLIAKYGYDQGQAKTDRIWLGGIQRSVDMPSWYVEALITNDDDGNLQNGTPDACEIDQAFGSHGLAQPVGGLVEVNEIPQADGSVAVELAIDEGFSPCGEPLSPNATLFHRPRPTGAGAPSPSVIDMVEVEPGLLRALIPAPADYTVTQYRIEFDWGNGTNVNRPDNRADEWYELWTGPLTEIWCADFEAGGDAWSFDGDWDIGQPQGFGGDPDAAWSGTNVAGIRLDSPGIYSTWTTSTLSGPSIDVSEYEAVRLQYRRWLNIEDGYWDQAWILANGEVAWQNFATDFEGFATVHHRDREWRFHDVDLTPFVGPEGSVSLDFLQSSDGGLEFGGWTIDEVCLYGHGAPAGGGCGDGVVQAFEQCDDGNLANGDGCSSGCLFEDDDEPEPEPEPELGWDPSGRGCGCLVDSDEDPATPIGALGLLALVGIGLRRRQRLRPPHLGA